MKKITLFTSFILISFFCFSQKEKSGFIERNNYGAITSVEFSPADKEKPQSANDFFVQYLETREHDRFEKIQLSQTNFYPISTAGLKCSIPTKGADAPHS